MRERSDADDGPRRRATFRPVVPLEHVYRYAGGSSLDRRLEPAAYLATDRREAETSPYFFSGFLPDARRDASLLLGISRIASSRFHTASAAVAAEVRRADPVVTSDGDRLRFESFSICNGVYARLDVEDLPGEVQGVGTTNVDFGAELLHALTSVRRGELVHLSVGADELALAQVGSAVIERRVELPRRWLRGFAEVARVQVDLPEAIELDRARARRFLSVLARHPHREEVWLASGARMPELAADPMGTGVFIAGLDRLRPLAEHAAVVDGLRIFGGQEPGSASAWVADLGGRASPSS